MRLAAVLCALAFLSPLASAGGNDLWSCAVPDREADASGGVGETKLEPAGRDVLVRVATPLPDLVFLAARGGDRAAFDLVVVSGASCVTYEGFETMDLGVDSLGGSVDVAVWFL